MPAHAQAHSLADQALVAEHLPGHILINPRRPEQIAAQFLTWLTCQGRSAARLCASRSGSSSTMSPFGAPRSEVRSAVARGTSSSYPSAPYRGMLRG